MGRLPGARLTLPDAAAFSLVVQQLEALKELSLKLNPQGSNPEL